MPKNNKTSLGYRIKELRLSLQKPYYFFSMMENGDILLDLEDEKGDKVFFREKTMAGCVQKAEDYLVASKIRAGQEAKIKEQTSPPTSSASPTSSPASPTSDSPSPSETEEDDGIEIETSIRDDKGEKHPPLG